MAHRIEPFRDYSEHEVINLFALDFSTLVKLNADGTAEADSTLADMKNLSGGQWDSGVVVEVSGGGLPTQIPGRWSENDASPDADLRAYLGHAHANAHIGFNDMPQNTLTVKPSKGAEAIGITLRQTVAYDENGENLLRYPVKKDELQAVGPGETVPVLTRGLVLLNASAVKGDLAVGDPIAVNHAVANDDETAADAGMLMKDAAGNNPKIGVCLAVDGTSGAKKYLCKLSF